MTKSIIKAKDYDVKIKFDGVEQFISLGDILINEKPLNDYLKDLGDVINYFGIFEKEYQSEIKRLNSIIKGLSNENVKLDKKVKGLKKVVEKAIVNKMKVGF